MTTDPELTADKSCSDRVAVVFISHILCESVLDRFRKLVRESRPYDDVYLLFDATNATTEDCQRAQEVASEHLRTFVRPEVIDNDYPWPWADSTRRDLVPGNLDLLYLYFAQREPGYSRYWFVEYDVVYTGTWADLFMTFENSTAGLVGTTLRSYDNNPNWPWWSSLDPASDLAQAKWRRGFFPIIRLNRHLLKLVDEAYRAGWSGHSEAVLPTLASSYDLELEDIGGTGSYVNDGNENRFYRNTPGENGLSPGTFVYRPALPRPGFRSGTLWHPVKPEQTYVRFLRDHLIWWAKKYLREQ